MLSAPTHESIPVTLKRSAVSCFVTLPIPLALASLALACSPSVPDVGGSGGSGSGGGPSPASGGTTSGVGGAGASTGGAGAGGTSGGAGGNANPGTGGDATGTGGASGTGGSAATGGAAGTGGNAGSGGAPVVVEKPPLVTSGQGSACSPTLEGCSYWRTDGAVSDSAANADVTVTTTARQVFTGFGGSFNEEGWQVLLDLTEPERAKALALLFDAADGAKFVYGRIPIGASDYAVAPRYSLQESASAPFTIERDQNLLIP